MQLPLQGRSANSPENCSKASNERRIHQPRHLPAQFPRLRVLVGEDDHGESVLDKARHTGGKAYIHTGKIEQFVTTEILHHSRYKFPIGGGWHAVFEIREAIALFDHGGAVLDYRQREAGDEFALHVIVDIVVNLVFEIHCYLLLKLSYFNLKSAANDEPSCDFMLTR